MRFGDLKEIEPVKYTEGPVLQMNLGFRDPKKQKAGVGEGAVIGIGYVCTVGSHTSPPDSCTCGENPSAFEQGDKSSMDPGLGTWEEGTVAPLKETQDGTAAADSMKRTQQKKERFHAPKNPPKDTWRGENKGGLGRLCINLMGRTDEIRPTMEDWPVQDPPPIPIVHREPI